MTNKLDSFRTLPRGAKLAINAYGATTFRDGEFVPTATFLEVTDLGTIKARLDTPGTVSAVRFFSPDEVDVMVEPSPTFINPESSRWRGANRSEEAKPQRPVYQSSPGATDTQLLEGILVALNVLIERSKKN